MRTEEYIIILVGVVAGQEQIDIIYTSNAPENITSIRIMYNNGKIIQTFDRVKSAERGQLTFPVTGLMPGSYTCSISVDHEIKDSKKFVIG